MLLSGSAIQSVMSSGDALTPGKTGGVGSAVFNLYDNGTLHYQVCESGRTLSEVKETLAIYLLPSCPRSKSQASPAKSSASLSS